MFSSHSVVVPISRPGATLVMFSSDDSFCSEAHKGMAGEAESRFAYMKGTSLGHEAHGQEMSEYLQQTYKQCNSFESLTGGIPHLALLI